ALYPNAVSGFVQGALSDLGGCRVLGCDVSAIQVWQSWAFCCTGVRGPPGLSRQRCQERLRLLKVGGVKALGEPAIDCRQQCVGLGPLALLLPQACQAGGSPEFQGFGLLAVGGPEGVVE